MDRAGTWGGLLPQIYMERNKTVFKLETSFISAVCGHTTKGGEIVEMVPKLRVSARWKVSIGDEMESTKLTRLVVMALY